jgi:hypothetical protein
MPHVKNFRAGWRADPSTPRAMGAGLRIAATGAIVAAAVLGAPSAAFAARHGGTELPPPPPPQTVFTEQSGFGAGATFSSCKTGASSGVFASGTVIGAANISGPCTGFFTVSLDTTAQTITLTGAQVGNFETGLFAISGITGATITGLSTLSYASLFDPAAGNGTFATDVPTPQLSFTADSIQILFSSIGSPSGQFVYDAGGGQAVFSYAVGGLKGKQVAAFAPNAVLAVPEPATWALMLLGFGGMGAILRGRRVQRLPAA